MFISLTIKHYIHDGHTQLFLLNFIHILDNWPSIFTEKETMTPKWRGIGWHSIKTINTIHILSHLYWSLPLSKKNTVKYGGFSHYLYLSLTPAPTKQS
uniref:Uncharacterized protein n=1 Tax=Lepeophtheirus salmonis TaxID=72036 RepID=A0A0K2V6G9_LEPSM